MAYYILCMYLYIYIHAYTHTQTYIQRNTNPQLQQVLPAWAIAAISASVVTVVLTIFVLGYQFLKYRRLYSQYVQVGASGAVGRQPESFELAED